MNPEIAETNFIININFHLASEYQFLLYIKFPRALLMFRTNITNCLGNKTYNILILSLYSIGHCLGKVLS